MHMILAVTLALADGLLGLIFGVFAIAMVYVAIQTWLSGETWKLRLAIVFFVCVLASASVQLMADASRHLGEVAAALIS
ncbi:MAG TPA: hypothetical protein VKQ30_10135 [Ktedonobacterales bacterium]|nr:hypothetical protein [Ktedonobacterales bacterium]